LPGSLARDAEFMADDIEGDIVEVIPAHGVSLLGRQPFECGEKTTQDIALLSLIDGGGCRGISVVFVEYRCARCFGREICKGRKHLASGKADVGGDFGGLGATIEQIGEGVVGLSHGADSLPSPTGEGIEAPQLIEHGSTHTDEAEGSGFFERTGEAPRRLDKGFAAGRE
jgi:hypothetical protein